jgi:hypothetical protein
MNSKQYYRMGAYIVGLICCSLILLIAFTLEKKPSTTDHSKLTMIQELRLYRQLLSDVKTTNNPKISNSLKETCSSELDAINAMIDTYEEGNNDELSMRIQLEAITQKLLSDPYLSTTGRSNKPLVNAKLDI